MVCAFFPEVRRDQIRFKTLPQGNKAAIMKLVDDSGRNVFVIDYDRVQLPEVHRLLVEFEGGDLCTVRDCGCIRYFLTGTSQWMRQMKQQFDDSC